MADDYGVRIFFESGGRTTVEVRGGDADEVELNAARLIDLAESNDVIAQAIADVGLDQIKPKPKKQTSKRRVQEEDEPEEEEEEEELEDGDEPEEDEPEEEEAPRTRRRTGTRKSTTRARR